MSITFSYVEMKTFNSLLVGDGSIAWRHWGVMDHEGITIQLEFLSYPEKKTCYLPAKVLKKLYSNFDQSYEYGGVLYPGDIYEIISKAFYDLKTANDMNESREGFTCLNYAEEDEGYPYLVKFLPELHNINFIESLAKDPTLDQKLLSKFLSTNSLQDKYENRHPRWSIEWLRYCENLVIQNSDMQILDKSNFFESF